MPEGILTCSNCGKRIPATGRVCPYCHADKAKDKTEQGFIIAGLVLGGVIGAVIAPSVCAATWYGVGGALLGGLLGAVIGKAVAKQSGPGQ